MERLQKFLANNSVASRRKCEELILNGKVKVNGKQILNLGYKIDPQKDEVFVDDKKVIPEKKYYYIINKPLGIVTSMHDQFGRDDMKNLIKDVIKDVNVTLKPIGRLDMYTTGALILTNDGDLINSLIHPKFEIEKTYLVTLNKNISNEQIDKLKQGVLIENNGKDYLTKPAKVVKLHDKKIAITICEGKNRQIRKMINSIGLKVLALHRSSFANIKINDLKPSMARELSNKEVQYLKSL